MGKAKRNFSKIAAFLMSFMLVFSMFTGLNLVNTYAVSYSEMSALDQYAYGGDDLGATYTKSATTFKVWSPTASKVQIKRYKTGSDSEAGAGVIDITGHPDGSCRYASTVWGLEKAPVIAVKPVNHPGVRPGKSVWRGTNAITSWAWADCTGNKAEVEVYSDADRVELFLGGKSLGRKKIKECKAIFKTKYASEDLTAVAYSAEGKETGRSSLSPARGHLKLRLTREESNSDIHYIPVEIVGENDVVESNADCLLKVSVIGGTLLGFGSANPCHEEDYCSGEFTSYYGRALAVVRTDSRDESCRVTVSGGDLEAAIII